jgi:glycosyltransferase involved in cell wall biosynthesis
MRAFEHSEMLVRVLREEKIGKANALNHGIEEAKGRVFLFTDDDVRFPSDWIREMAQPILSGPADAVAGGVELAEEIQEDWMTARHRELLASTERIDPEQPEHMVGANMAIAQCVFDEVPQFDPELGPGRLGLGEETLFFYQMQEAGFQIETAFDVTVRHHPDRSRLSCESWMDAARKSGRAGAYISYHWEHRRHSLPALYAGWMYYICLLYWKKNVGWKSNNENICIQEILLRRKIERIKKHLKENGKKSKYNKK